MNKKLAAPQIDFADSEYKSFHMSDSGNLTIYMNNWQETPMKLLFFHTIKFLYAPGDVPKNLFEVFENSNILEEAIIRTYGHNPKDHPYKLFQLEDIYDFPFIQVVAESVTVER